MTALESLLQQSGHAMVTSPPELYPGTPFKRALHELLLIKNGFTAINGALRVFPSTSSAEPHAPYDVSFWNNPSTWAGQAGMTQAFFFAETILGIQYGFKQDGIVRFDPETKSTQSVGCGLEQWAGQMLANNLDISRAQAAINDLSSTPAPREQILLVTPLCLGGLIEKENMRYVDSVSAMRIRAEITARMSGSITHHPEPSPY